jgi:glycosyltransferase involved in cell wall biosynthesis
MDRSNDQIAGRPPRILYLVTEDWYFLSHRLSIALACRRAGWDVTVATRVGRHLATIESHGLEVIPIRLVRGGRNPIQECLAIAEIVRVLRASRPDIVQHVGLKPIVYGGVASRLAGVPVSLSLFAGLGYLFISGTLGVRLLRAIIKTVLRQCFASPRHWVIAQNDDDAEDIVASRLIERDRIAVIKGSGVDTRRYMPIAEPDGPVTVAVVGRMLKDKGIFEVVEAARELKRRRVPVRIVLAGEPDGQNPGNIPVDRLKHWHDEGWIEWLGQVADIPALWAGAHVALLPSHREGLPRALLEAAACGRPIVTTDVPGCRDVVAHGVNGLLVAPFSPVAIADAVETLVRDSGLRVRMGAAGRARVEAEFGDDVVIARTLDLYRDLLALRVPAAAPVEALGGANAGPSTARL